MKKENNQEEANKFVRRIQKEEGNYQCFRTTKQCQRHKCLWYPYCVGELKDTNSCYDMYVTYLLSGRKALENGIHTKRSK